MFYKIATQYLSNPLRSSEKGKSKKQYSGDLEDMTTK
jgi:hypothetical protein